MKTLKTLLSVSIILITVQSYGQASSFGSGYDVQEFYKPFTLEDITPGNMQKWPYYKYVSANWDEYGIHGTTIVNKSSNPTKLAMGEPLDMNIEFENGQTYIEALQSTQVKGFIVMKDNEILAEFYDNGFNVDQTNLLQSSSKTFTALVVHQLIEQGLIDPSARMDSYVKEFAGADIGKATVQQVLDHTSGLPTAIDWHTHGSPGQLYEVEQGLQPGKTSGLINAIKSTKATAVPGVEYNYSDLNTDALSYLSEIVSNKKFPELLSELFDAFGANYDGSAALGSD